METILAAVRDDEPEILNNILRSGFDASHTYDVIHVLGPVHLAAQKGHIECIRILDLAGFDMNARDRTGLTPIMHAIAHAPHDGDKYNRYVDSVSYLLQHFNRHDKHCDHSGTTLLHLVSRSPTQYAHLVTRVLQYGYSVNATDLQGLTPLMVAVKNRNYAAVNYLLASNADIKLKDTNQRTSLHYAVSDGKMARILLEAGASCQARDCRLQTPLMQAVQSRITPTDEMSVIIQHLIAFGSDVNAVDSRGTTLLLHAMSNLSRINYEHISILISAGADPDITDSDGLSVAWLAAEAGRYHPTKCLQIIRLLISSNSVIDAPCMGRWYQYKTPVTPIKVAMDSHFYLGAQTLLFGSISGYTDIWKMVTSRYGLLTDDEVLNDIVQLISNPFSLLQLSRQVIRHSLGKNIQTNIKHLDLPPTISGFILFHDDSQTIHA